MASDKASLAVVNPNCAEIAAFWACDNAVACGGIAFLAFTKLSCNKTLCDSLFINTIISLLDQIALFSSTAACAAVTAALPVFNAVCAAVKLVWAVVASVCAAVNASLAVLTAAAFTAGDWSGDWAGKGSGDWAGKGAGKGAGDWAGD